MPYQIDDEILEEVIDGVENTVEEPVDLMGQPSEKVPKKDVLDELSVEEIAENLSKQCTNCNQDLHGLEER